MGQNYDKKEFSFTGLLLGLVASMYVVIEAYNRASDEVKKYDAVILTLFVAFAIILLAVGLWKNRQVQKVAGSLFLVCILLSTCLESYITNNNRWTAYTWTEAIGYDGHTMTNDTIDALQYLKEQDKDFFRVDKGYAAVSTYGDSQVMGYSSVTDYNSTINRHLADFIICYIPK